MKMIAILTLATLLPLASFAGWYQAGDAGSRPSEDIKLNPATLDSVTTLVSKTVDTKVDVGYRNLQVKVIVNSTGGSTDVSPQKKIYLGLYSENEMYNLSGTYEIGSAFKLSSITRVEGGIYKITGELNEPGQTMTIHVNAVNAVNELKTMSCGEFANCRTKQPVQVIVK